MGTGANRQASHVRRAMVGWATEHCCRTSVRVRGYRVLRKGCCERGVAKGVLRRGVAKGVLRKGCCERVVAKGVTGRKCGATCARRGRLPDALHETMRSGSPEERLLAKKQLQQLQRANHQMYVACGEGASEKQWWVALARDDRLCRAACAVPWVGARASGGSRDRTRVTHGGTLGA